MAFNAEQNQNEEQNKTTAQAPQAAGAGQALSGSGGDAGPGANASGRVAQFSTGSQAGATGSGRFTNLQKYIGANEGAGQHLGDKLGQTYNKDVGDQTANISKQNSNIASAVDSAKGVVGRGNEYNNQLTNIGSGLNSFNSMEDRAGFDAAGKQAQAFATAPTFGDYQNIQQNKAVNTDQLNTDQAAAAAAGSTLNNTTAQYNNQINSQTGRNQLLNQVFGKKNQYTQGGLNFDQLLLQSAPGNVLGNLQQSFNQGNQNAQALNTNIANQGKDVTGTVGNYNDIVSKLNTSAQTAQNAFNDKLGQQSNLDYINKVRGDVASQYNNALSTGKFDADTAAGLGLAGITTYNPTAQGEYNTQGGNKTISTYNTNLGAYVNQNTPQAMSTQDITTQGDYDAYKALQNISGIDSGKIAGTSKLGTVADAFKNNTVGGKTLADSITGQDADFLKNYAGQNYNSTAFGAEGGPGSGVTIGGLAGVINSAVTNPLAVNSGTVAGGLGGGTAAGNLANSTGASQISDKGYGSGVVGSGSNTDLAGYLANLKRAGGGGSVAGSITNANIDDYIRNGTTSTQGNLAFDNGGDSRSNSTAIARANDISTRALQDYLNGVITNTGVKNTATVGNQANNVINNAAIQRYKGLF